MSALELSSDVLEIPNNAYTALSQNLIGWSTLSQARVLQADWLIMENNEKATVNIKVPLMVGSEYLFSLVQQLLSLVMSNPCSL